MRREELAHVYALFIASSIFMVGCAEEDCIGPGPAWIEPLERLRIQEWTIAEDDIIELTITTTNLDNGEWNANQYEMIGGNKEGYCIDVDNTTTEGDMIILEGTYEITHGKCLNSLFEIKLRNKNSGEEYNDTYMREVMYSTGTMDTISIWGTWDVKIGWSYKEVIPRH